MLRIIILIILIPAIIPSFAAADVLHLKDGTTIKVSKIWEEDGLVRFYLPDYEGITITYSKDIIARIEKGDGKPEKHTPATENEIPESKKQAGIAKGAKPAMGESTRQDESPPPKPGQKTKTATIASSHKQAPPVKPGEISQRPNSKKTTSQPKPSASPRKVASPGPETADYAQLDGMQFYSPRRTYKYWSGLKAKHRTLNEALTALAQEFNQSPDWVAEHLGDTNDLGQIYRNLARTPIDTASTDLGAREAVEQEARILFYDPRRPYKYWVSETSRFRTLNEAVNLLAGLYDRPSEWIKANLGEANLVGEIHENLARAKSAEAEN